MSLGWPLLARQGLRHIAAARRKDWYDIAFLLVTTKTAAYGGSGAVREVFGDPTGTICTQLQDLQANYADSSTQGTSAFMNQITLDHPEVDPSTPAADAILLVGTVTDRLLGI